MKILPAKRFSLLTGLLAALTVPGKAIVPLFLIALAASQAAIARNDATDHILAGENWQIAGFSQAPAVISQRTSGNSTANNVRQEGSPLMLNVIVDGISLSLELSPSPVNAAVNISLTEALTPAEPLGSATTLAVEDTAELFIGVVTDDPESWVRLAREGDQAFSGQIKAYGHYYELKPDHRQRTTRLRKLPSLSVQLESLQQFPMPATGLDYELHAPPPAIGPLHIRPRDSAQSLQQLRFEDGIAVPGALRIAAVVDSRFNEHHNGRGVTRALSLVNVIDGIYQEQFGVAIVLDSVVAYTDPATDPMRGEDRPVSNILDNFRSVRLQEPQLRPDLTMVHLFTGLRDPQGVLGLGWINTACRTDGYDISVSTPFTYDALLAAHEMAHNLGALHDDSTSCATDRSNIMWPRLSGQTAPSFSQCTLNAVRDSLAAPCNLDNIDLSVNLESQRGPDGSGRLLAVSVINNDPVRDADSVRTLVRLPLGSNVIELPSVCTLTLVSAIDGPEVVCEIGDIPPLIGRRLDIVLSLSTTPNPQWTRVDAASLVAADSQPTNNTAQLDLRIIGATGGGVDDDESVVVASANSEIIGGSIISTAPQPVPGTQATQLFLPDGSSLILDDSSDNRSGVTGGSGQTGWSLLLVLLLGLVDSRYRVIGKLRQCVTIRIRRQHIQRVAGFLRFRFGAFD